MNFPTFAVCMTLIGGLAIITAGVNWRKDTKDLRKVIKRVRRACRV
jgi:hypothetical protein